MTQPTAAWFPDPDDSTRLRWWDGAQWTEHYAPVPTPAPRSDGATAASLTRWRPTALFWSLGGIVVFIALVSAITEGFGAFLIVLGVTALITGVYALATKRGSWASIPASSTVRALVVAASAIALIAGVGIISATHPAAPTPLADKSVSDVAPADRSPSPAPTPTPTPTPTVDLADVSTSAPIAAQDALSSAGFTVVMKTADGSPNPTDWAGWTVTQELPAPGAALPAGSTVTLVLSPPPPPPPPPVVAPAPPAPRAPAVPRAPAAPVAPGGGPTALCNDGSLSYSAHHQGTCSHHGGVAVFYK